MTLKAPITRRVITDTGEIKDIEGQQEERIARALEEQKKNAEAEREAMEAMEKIIDAPEEFRPRCLADFEVIVATRHPFWDNIRVGVEARLMAMRWPKVERAYLYGLKVGRDLKERSAYNVGWWWAELEDLLPFERSFVVEKVKRTIGINKQPKEK